MNAIHNRLQSQCTVIQTKMSALAEAMKVLGSAPRSAGASAARRPSRRSRPSRRPSASRGARPVRGPRGSGNSLKDFIRNVVSSSSKPMRLMDITDGVVKAGYETSSKNLSNQVSMALAKMSKKRIVRKVDRGVYAL